MCVFMFNINPFSFDPIISDIFLEKSKFEFLESKNFVLTIVNLDQTLEHIETKGLTNLGPTILPGQFVHDDQISRLMTHLLVNFEYISLFDIWA